MSWYEASLRFTLKSDDPEEFLALPVRWREDEVYMLIIKRHEVEIVEQWGSGKPSTYAKRTRHFRLNTPYWVRFCASPDPLMPAHPRVAVYFWKDGQDEPKSTTFPYPSKRRWVERTPEEKKLRAHQQFKRFIRQESIGFQTDAEGKVTHDIHECMVEYWDGTQETVWRAWPTTVPWTQDKYLDFLFEKPRIDIPLTTGKIHTSL